MWRTRSIVASETGSSIDEELVNDIQEKRSNIIDELSGIINQRPADEVRVQVRLLVQNKLIIKATTLLIDLYTLFTTLDEPARGELLAGDMQMSVEMQDNIINVLEEEINLLHLSEKKSSNIVGGEDDHDDEDEEMPDVAELSPERRSAIHEGRVCEIAARMTLAILGGALPKTLAQTLQRHKGKVGQSYDKIILELGTATEKSGKELVKKTLDPAVIEDPIEVNSPMEDA